MAQSLAGEAWGLPCMQFFRVFMHTLPEQLGLPELLVVDTPVVIFRH